MVEKIPDEIAELSASLIGVAPPKKNEPGVYFLCFEGVVVYVGQSRRVLSRVYEHVNCKKFDYVFYVPVPEDRLDAVEMHWIKRLQPILNGNGTERQAEARRNTKEEDVASSARRNAITAEMNAATADPESLVHLPLPAVVKRRLFAGGYRTASDVLETPINTLLAVRGIGASCCDHLIRLQEANGTLQL